MRIRHVVAAGTAALLASALATGPEAQAADYPVLRGSQIEDTPPAPDFASGSNWSGFYFGGLAGYTDTNFSPGRGPQALIANHLRGTTIEAEMGVSEMLNIPSYSKRKAAFGGFVGYNMQFGDVVLGVEGDYSRLDVSGSGSDEIGRSMQLSDGYIGSAFVTGAVSARAEQLATLRIRAGYTIGQFMPFITGGLAYGTGTVVSSATVRTSYIDADPSTAPFLPTFDTGTTSLFNRRSNASMLGGVIGGGVEALFGGLLLRGEVLYARMEAQGNVVVEHTTGRVGAGVKF